MNTADIEWSAHTTAWTPRSTTFTMYARTPGGGGVCAQATFEHSLCLDFPGMIPPRILADIIQRTSEELLRVLRETSAQKINVRAEVRA